MFSCSTALGDHDYTAVVTSPALDGAVENDEAKASDNVRDGTRSARLSPGCWVFLLSVWVLGGVMAACGTQRPLAISIETSTLAAPNSHTPLMAYSFNAPILTEFGTLSDVTKDKDSDSVAIEGEVGRGCGRVGLRDRAAIGKLPGSAGV